MLHWTSLLWFQDHVMWPAVKKGRALLIEEQDMLQTFRAFQRVRSRKWKYGGSVFLCTTQLWVLSCSAQQCHLIDPYSNSALLLTGVLNWSKGTSVIHELQLTDKLTIQCSQQDIPPGISMIVQLLTFSHHYQVFDRTGQSPGFCEKFWDSWRPQTRTYLHLYLPSIVQVISKDVKTVVYQNR